MNESRRRAYLEAMGFDIWSAKPPETEANRLLVQAGQGDTLLVCDSPGVTESPFASDIARVLGGAVVWAWPDPAGSFASPTLEEAVGQHLFTRVVLFGAGLGLHLFRGEAPLVVGSARILVTRRIEDLVASGSAKLVFWNQLSGLRSN